MDETVDPYTAGLGFGVKLDAGDFIGKEAVTLARETKDRPKRVGLILDGRRIAREGAAILIDDREVGRVTSGTFSPTLEQSIAMGYVPSEHSNVGTNVEVDIRGKRIDAVVTKLPFYRRS